MQAKEVWVMQAADLPEGNKKVVSLGETEVGVYRVKGKLYAYENLCPHQGGPACEGLMMPKVEDVITEDKRYEKMRFNYDEWHVVCPWHAWEYDVTTGQCVADRNRANAIFWARMPAEFLAWTSAIVSRIMLARA